MRALSPGHEAAAGMHAVHRFAFTLPNLAEVPDFQLAPEGDIP